MAETKSNNKLLTLLSLHLLLLFFSVSGIFSKKAGMAEKASFEFFFYYGLVLLILVVYTVFWQQIIKRMPLTTAFCNKSVNVIWGILWGYLFFDEMPTVYMLIGAVLVIAGVILVVTDNER